MTSSWCVNERNLLAFVFLTKIINILLIFTFQPFKMGNKEAKFKKIFEEIDTSGDCKVSLDELINFLGEKLVFLFTSQALKKGLCII